jgi:recombination protein RecT
MATNVAELQLQNEELKQKKMTFLSALDRNKHVYLENMPKGLRNPERLLSVARAAVITNPKVLRTDPLTLLLAINQACQLGLEINSPVQQCYVIPRWNTKRKISEAQLMIGYRGYITLARRSERVIDIEARLVNENDKFSLIYSESGTLLQHTPSLDKPGKMKGAYAIAVLPGVDGHRYSHVEYMRLDEIMAIKKGAADGSPWYTNEGEMARKSPIRRLAKYLDLSPDFDAASSMDDVIIRPAEGADLDAALRGQVYICAATDGDDEDGPTSAGDPAAPSQQATASQAPSRAEDIRSSSATSHSGHSQAEQPAASAATSSGSGQPTSTTRPAARTTAPDSTATTASPSQSIVDDEDMFAF